MLNILGVKGFLRVAGISGFYPVSIYLFINVGTFGCIICTRRNGQAVEKISDLAGASKGDPMMALALFVLMFSMAGIPSLAVFFGNGSYSA